MTRDHHAPVTAIPEVGLVAAACDCGWTYVDEYHEPAEARAVISLAGMAASMHRVLAPLLEAPDA